MSMTRRRPQDNELAAQKEAQTKFLDLPKVIDSSVDGASHSERGTKVVLYFDSAHTLPIVDAVIGGDPNGKTLYDVLCPTISCLAGYIYIRLSFQYGKIFTSPLGGRHAGAYHQDTVPLFP
ncbi:hypothetical protein FRB96_003758 [Tulasnella sp. 330]|nr:hypothetical protein FRB96_003758 [Tulasnella sp. 330]